MTTKDVDFTIPSVLSSDDESQAQRITGIMFIGGLSFGTFFTFFVLPTVCCAVKFLRALKLSYFPHMLVEVFYLRYL
jgi:hypothetical protein